MYKNDDPFKPWNNPMYADDPFAPHNDYDKDNPSKPWNDPFGDLNDLDDDEAKYYGVKRNKDRYQEEDEDY